MIDQRFEKGQGLVEYALIIVLIAVVVITAVVVFGATLNGTFSDINTALDDITYIMQIV